LRVRRISGNWIQTVKGKGEALAGLHQRQEFESELYWLTTAVVDPTSTKLRQCNSHVTSHCYYAERSGSSIGIAGSRLLHLLPIYSRHIT